MQRLIHHFLNAFDLDVEDIKMTKICIFGCWLFENAFSVISRQL